MKKTTIWACVAAVAASATISAFAGSAEANGTDFVVTAAAGESFTNSTAIGNYARLLKEGDGEVVLTAATTAFTGDVLVKEGTLTITSLKAVGTGTPVTVQDGATFYLKTPHAGNQSDALFTGHDITIAGKGVGGMGALRYKQTSGSGCADNMFSKITLADDATIAVESRFGMFYNTYPLDLAGHTLTRIGGGLWMFFSHVKSTGGPGTIVSTAGNVTFQNDLIIDENVTFVITNSTGSLGLWGTYATSKVKGLIKVYTGRSIAAQSGTDGTRNHLGPVHAAGEPAKFVTLATTYSNSHRSMSIDGPLTCDHEVRISKTGTGPLWLNGPVEMPGSTNYFKIEGGQLYLTNNVSRNCRFVAQGNSTITQSRGSFLMRMMRISQGSGVQYHQTGGIMAVPSYDAGRIGEFSGTRGYYTLEGGEFHASNTLYLAERVGSFGAFRQTGGLFEMRNSGGSSALRAGYGGSGLFVQTGGTNDTLGLSTSQGGGFLMGTNGLSEATVSGTGTLFRTSLILFGEKDSASTNIFNMKDGVVVKANRFRKQQTSGPATRVYVNADGATLMPTFAWGWTATGGDVYARSPDHFVVWKKGLVFDTSENATNSGAGGTEIPFWFDSPTGKGVESVALPTSSSFNATNYLGIARVVFEDETGWGASAYAEYDFTQKKVTKIVVTSRGCDYSEGTKAYLESPDRSTRYECALTLSSNEGMCGEFVKRGAPYLDLFATNTVTGGIAVEGGSLRTRTNGVIPSNTPVRVESGATLDLYNKGGITVSTFTGAGQVINGAVTVTNAVRASCADIFAGKHATFASNLTFAPGATFTITDPENLAAYAHSASATAFTATSVNGTPTLTFEGGEPQGVKWSLFKKNDTTYNFGAVIGTMILVR